MEEKLYFKPEGYGKGKKKKQAEQTGKPKAEKNNKALRLIGILLFLLVAVVIIIWLLHGNTTTTGQYPENVNNESLICTSNSLVPEKINSIDSEDKEIKINAVFDGTDELKRIYFTYTLKYANEDEAYGAEAKSHAFFNKALSASGYKVDKFENKFSRYNEKLIIGLTMTKDELDEFSAPYFMLKPDESGRINLRTINDFQNNYESQGFTCESTIKGE